MIRLPNTQVVNVPIYSISGVCMNKDRYSLPKGIYIQGGKKFVVK